MWTSQYNEKLFLAFWAAIGFVAAQRFSLSDIAGIICLVPLFAAIVNFRRNPDTRNSFLLLALFWSTDNAVLDFGTTIGPIRYLVYVVAISAFIVDTKVQRRGLIVMSSVVVFYTVVTFVSHNELSETQFFRDLQILALLATLFVLKGNKPFNLNVPILMVTITAYLVSELSNFFVFREFWHGHYMSYDSTKYLIVFPSLVALLARRSLPAFMLIFLTIPVLIGYTSRTLFLAYIVCIIFIFAFWHMKHGQNKRVLAISVTIVVLMLNLTVVDLNPLFAKFKALNIVPIVQTHGLAVIELLDPVRYNSSLMFFQLPISEILFGRGLGSGIEDVAGRLDFVLPEQTAFSLEELNTRYFYNFHDFWVDIGLRFGLLPLLYFLVWFMFQRPKHSYEGNAVWLVAIIGLCSAFFSAAGLISVFFLMRYILSLRDPL